MVILSPFYLLAINFIRWIMQFPIELGIRDFNKSQTIQYRGNLFVICVMFY